MQCAAPALRSDRQVVLEAVSRDGSALQFAASELRSDPEVVLGALRSNISAAVSELGFQSQKVSAIKAGHASAKIWQHVAPELRSDQR